MLKVDFWSHIGLALPGLGAFSELCAALSSLVCAVQEWLVCPMQAFQEDPAARQSGRALPPNPLLLGMSMEAYMLKQLASVRAGDLEQSLLILPFSDALRLLAFFCTWLEQGAEVRDCSCPIFCLMSCLGVVPASAVGCASVRLACSPPRGSGQGSHILVRLHNA